MYDLITQKNKLTGLFAESIFDLYCSQYNVLVGMCLLHQDVCFKHYNSFEETLSLNKKQIIILKKEALMNEHTMYMYDMI